ncbi:MATE efflux family protein [Legionella busanensis]|uniref:MATE efflux family protein n=1 Tax=Legionella busanensis TaxID=190655 RepID=A0A378JI54_9GAMM|nr:MATE family efflux transporter [Legionella busanensis]STX50996.1 MATE efflux family protein [Legionella busanensis]
MIPKDSPSSTDSLPSDLLSGETHEFHRQGGDLTENSFVTIPLTNDLENVEPDDIEEFYSFGRVFKTISKLSIPMALSFTFSIEIFLIVILLNNLNENDNENDVAAATLISVLLNALAVIGMSPLFSMSVLASNKIGELNEAEKRGEDLISLQEKREYIASINRNGLWMSAVLTPPVMAGMFFSKPLLTNLFGQNEDVAQIAQNFLRTYSPAIAGLMVRISSEQMMFSFGRAMPAMLIGLANLGLGTGLSIWLGKGGVGVPKLGGTGIAIGFVAEAYLTALFYSLYLAKHKDFKQFEFFKIFKRYEGQFTQLRQLLKIGGSISFAVASEMSMSFAVGVFSGLIGTRAQSAITYVNQFIFLNFLGLASFGQSSSQEVSRLIGAKSYENASRMGKYSLLSTMIYTSPIPAFFAIMPSFLIISGPNKDELTAILKYLVPAMAPGIIADAARYNLLQQLRPLGDIKGATFVSVSGLSIGIILSAVLGLKTSMGIYGVGAGNTVGVLIATGGLLHRWQSRIKPENIKKMAEAPLTNPTLLSSPTRSCYSFFNGLFNKYKEQNLLIEDKKNYGTNIDFQQP